MVAASQRKQLSTPWVELLHGHSCGSLSSCELTFVIGFNVSCIFILSATAFPIHRGCWCSHYPWAELVFWHGSAMRLLIVVFSISRWTRVHHIDHICKLIQQLMILTCSPYALIAFRLSLSFAIFNSTQNLHRTRAVHPFVNPFTVHGFVTNMSYQTVSLRTRKLSIHYLAPFRPHGIWTLFFIILSRRPYYRLAIIPFSPEEAFASLQTRMLRFLERRSWRRLYALIETLVAYRIIGSAASCVN